MTRDKNGYVTMKVSIREVNRTINTYLPKHIIQILRSEGRNGQQFSNSRRLQYPTFNNGGILQRENQQRNINLNYCSHEIKKTLTPWKKSYDQPR